MRFDPSGSGFCAMVLLGLSTLACSQAGQVGEIHVEAPATKEGIRMSFKGSGAVSTSPESARMLRDLMAANGVNMQPSERIAESLL